MHIVERVKKILLQPREEWAVIAREETTAAVMIFRYLLPLAGVSALAIFAGLFLISGIYGSRYGIYYAIVFFLQIVLTVYINAAVNNWLAPTFGSEKNFKRSLSLIVYSGTPVYMGSLLAFIPFLGWLAILVGAIYSLYLLYLGLPAMKNTPAKNLAGYLVANIVTLLLVYFVLQTILLRFVLMNFL